MRKTNVKRKPTSRMYWITIVQLINDKMGYAKFRIDNCSSIFIYDQNAKAYLFYCKLEATNKDDFIHENFY